MTRALAIAAAVLAIVAGSFLALGSGPASGPGDEIRAAAVFDTARGLVPGQQVKIAGAVVGKVQRVSVTHDAAPGPKARVELRIDGRFAPLRADASCAILPEGLISENYVECVPGSSPAPLRAGEGGLPEIPLAQTTVPTSLQDLLNAFSLPVDDRIRAIIDELGLATAGRGEDLDALLRRANPALQQTQRVLDIVDGQRARIGEAVTQTDAVLSSLGGREGDVRRFVRESAALTRTTAAHREGLGAAVRDLPPMLAAVRPGLRTLRRTARQATPLLRDLRTSAAPLRTLTARVPSFVAEGRPAVRALASAAAGGRSATRAARPVVRALRTAAAAAQRLAPDLDVLLRSTRDSGGFEGLLRAFYSTAVSMSAYDDISHIVGLAVSVFPQCMADPSTRGCNHNYYAPGKGTIPVNSPDCPAHGGATWDAPTTCVANPVRAKRRAPRPTTRVRPPRPAIRAPEDAPRRGGGGQRPSAGSRPPVVRLPELPSLPGLPKELPVPSLPGVDAPGLPDMLPLLDYLLAP